MKTSLISLLITFLFVSCHSKVVDTVKSVKAIDVSNTDSSQYLSGNCGKNVVDEIVKVAEKCSVTSQDCELIAKKFRDTYSNISCNVDLKGKAISINDSRVDEIVNALDNENTISSNDLNDDDYFEHESPAAWF